MIDDQWVGFDTAGIIEIALSNDDTLFGDQGNDVIYGNTGNDSLYGDSLSDALEEGLVAHWHFDEASGLTRKRVVLPGQPVNSTAP